MKLEKLRFDVSKEMTLDDAYELWNNSDARLHLSVSFVDWMQVIKNISKWHFI